MAQQFYATWSVTSEREGRNPIVLVNAGRPQSYSCRDGCFGSMSNTIWQYVANRIPSTLDPWSNELRDIYSWYIYNARDTFRVRATTYQANTNTEYISYSIPRIISKLENKFPSVTFAQDDDTVGLGTQVHGIVLSGNLEVLPAWYWATFLMRIAASDKNPSAKPGRPWVDVNQLIARSNYDETYPEMWDDLRNGRGQELVAGWKMLSRGGGPMTTGYNGDGGTYVGRLVAFVETNLARRERGEHLDSRLTQEIF